MSASSRLISIDRAVDAVAQSAWRHEGNDTYSQGMDAGARRQVDESVKALDALRGETLMATSTVPLDLSKSVQTSDGKPARIICATMVNGDFPVVVLVQDEPDGVEKLKLFSVEGKHCYDHQLSIVNVPPPEHRAWFNVYTNVSLGQGFESKDKADAAARSPRIACIEIIYREGDGL